MTKVRNKCEWIVRTEDFQPGASYPVFCDRPVVAIFTQPTNGAQVAICQKHLMEVDKANLDLGIHREHCPCAKCTMKRLPTINDPLISDALSDL